MRRLAVAAATVLIGAAGTTAPAGAEPPWIDAAARMAPPDDAAAEAEPEAAAARPGSGVIDERAAAVERALRAARAALAASLAGERAAPAGPAADGDMALSLPEAFIAAHLVVAAAPPEAPEPAVTSLAARSMGAAALQQGAGGAAPALALVTLPLPPQKPWPGLGPPMDILLPYTGLYMRALPELPPLVPRGRLASFDDGRPYAHFNAQLDCITDHQRFDRQSARQKFPHACGPTRDIDVGLPGFTTR